MLYYFFELIYLNRKFIRGISVDLSQKLGTTTLDCDGLHSGLCTIQSIHSIMTGFWPVYNARCTLDCDWLRSGLCTIQSVYLMYSTP